MQAFLCSGLVLFVALFAVGCQSSGNGGSLKAEQIVFDMECQISVSASEKEVACGMLKNSGTETIFILTSPETAKGLCERPRTPVLPLCARFAFRRHHARQRRR